MDESILEQKITNIITIAIKEKFKNLNTEHTELLIKHLTQVCILLQNYMSVDIDSFIKQITQNDLQDIFSLLMLLLPHFDLNTCFIITDLKELFNNYNNKADDLKSTYYYDHQIKTNEDLITYFKTISTLINRSLSMICNKLSPNWLNVFPYTMENYKKSDIYINFVNYWKDFTFPEFPFANYYNFKLGYHTMYGVIKSFMFDDIKKIKWMIYDIDDRQEVYPVILKIVNLLEIQNIINEPWDKLNESKKQQIRENWMSHNKDYAEVFYSLIMFYLRWEKDEGSLNKIKMSPNCSNVIIPNLKEVNKINKDGVDNIDIIIYKASNARLYNCLNEIFKLVDVGKVYDYIYRCSQQFRYTWYGYKCINKKGEYLSKNEYFTGYLNENVDLGYIGLQRKFYITPKIIYNYFKSLIHHTINENTDKKKFVELSISNSWDNVCSNNKKIFIKRLNNGFQQYTDKDSDDDETNTKYKINNWFNISSNLNKIFSLEGDRQAITDVHIKIYDKILIPSSSNLIADVLFECLVYNGILTYFKYNPEITDNSLLPDKNKRKDDWENMLLSKITLEPYKNAYHFLDNMLIEEHDIHKIKTSKWFSNFGADWICQIQIFHHFIHQRIIFITGATGAGKSTVFPFMTLYALKIINYNNNGKIICTQPRIQPTKGNATRIAESLGVPLKLEKKDGTVLNDRTINYIQYEFKGGEVVDEYYHPKLKLITDGKLYQAIKNEYIFKKKIIIKNTIEDFKISNLFDVLLVDESHEHNLYMDTILTLCKFATYMNNEVVLGIISATMDDDEPIYRKFYEPINDDWKAPIKTDLINIYRNTMDRRLHLSVPFGGMNFDVKEIYVPEKKDKEIEIIEEILSKSQEGDILIFKPGSGEIIDLVKKINDNIKQSDVIAIPFMKSIKEHILEIVKNISLQENKNKFIYDKKKYTIDDIYHIPSTEKLPIGTYKRFIIVATNIAEASITIDSLKFVIDDGRQKIKYYDVETNQDILIVKPISIPNQKQRRGRIGRVSPGTIYYTYDVSKLMRKVIYKYCSDNINDNILGLLSIEEENTNQFKFTDNNNPYIISENYGGIDSTGELLKQLPHFLQQQYSFINSNGKRVLFYISKLPNIDYTNIIYPDSNGKYTIDTLMDKTGNFFIIHPNELDIERNLPNSLLVKDTGIQYQNKVESIINYFKSLHIVNDYNKVTHYGKLIVASNSLFNFENNSIELVLTILELLATKYSIDMNINSKNTQVFINIVWYCVFLTNEINFSLPNYKKVFSDFLGKSDFIPINKLTLLKFDDIVGKLDTNLSNFDAVVAKETKKLMSVIVIQNNLTSKETLERMIYQFYLIKMKIELLEEMIKMNDPSIIINKKIKTLVSTTQSLKDINMNYLPILEEKYIKMINSLNTYEQICYFVCKNMKMKILLKMEGTPFYINYFDRKYKHIYRINHSPFNNNKIFTNVYNEYRNNIIFYLKSTEDNKISDIMWIPNKIINILSIDTPIKRKNVINAKELYTIYGLDESIRILKKTNIINDYIVNI
jgi:hypothetical protein